MSEDERMNMRLECLHMACRACGDDISFLYVLEAAQKYVDFVVGKKPELKIVSNDEEKKK